MCSSDLVLDAKDSGLVGSPSLWAALGLGPPRRPAARAQRYRLAWCSPRGSEMIGFARLLRLPETRKTGASSAALLAGRAWMASWQPSAAEHRMDPRAQSAAAGCADNARGSHTGHRPPRSPGREERQDTRRLLSWPWLRAIQSAAGGWVPSLSPHGRLAVTLRRPPSLGLLLGGWAGMARQRPTEQPTTWPPALQPAIAAIAAIAAAR